MIKIYFFFLNIVELLNEGSNQKPIYYNYSGIEVILSY